MCGFSRYAKQVFGLPPGTPVDANQSPAQELLPAEHLTPGAVSEKAGPFEDVEASSLPVASSVLDDHDALERVPAPAGVPAAAQSQAALRPAPESSGVSESDPTRNASTDSGPSDVDSGTATARRRTRRTLLPKIPSSKRCGTCHTCLHPHLKKACLQRRKEQLEQLDASGEIPLLMLPQYQSMTVTTQPNGHAAAAAATPPPPPKRQKQRPNYADLDAADGRPLAPPAAAAAAASAPAADDFITVELQRILSRKGGVASARFAPRLVRLLEVPSLGLEMRNVLLHILVASEPDVQKVLVHGGALVPLDTWLAAAGSGGKEAVLLAEVRRAGLFCADRCLLWSTLLVAIFLPAQEIFVLFVRGDMG